MTTGIVNVERDLAVRRLWEAWLRGPKGQQLLVNGKVQAADVLIVEDFIREVYAGMYCLEGLDKAADRILAGRKAEADKIAAQARLRPDSCRKSEGVFS